MASKPTTAIGIGTAIGLMIVALWLTALGMAGPILGGSISDLVGRLSWVGFGAIAAVPVAGLIVLTLSGYICALWVPHTRLALVQAIANVIYGIIMIVVGLVLVTTGLAAFVGLITLLLSFPFGTIAYFAEFGCNTSPEVPFNEALGDTCFAGVQLAAALAAMLKGLALAALLASSLRYAKVRGLLFAFALGVLMLVVVVAALTAVSGLPFLAHPLDAVITAVLGIVLIIYGVVVFIQSLFALAFAIAGQVG